MNNASVRNPGKRAAEEEGSWASPRGPLLGFLGSLVVLFRGDFPAAPRAWPDPGCPLPTLPHD